MRLTTIALTILILSGTLATAFAAPRDWAEKWKRANPVWRGIHLGVGSSSDLKAIASQIPALKGAGMNVLLLEVGYGFKFRSRPEMASQDGISFAEARSFAKLCHDKGIRLVPQVNCLGHQSWEGTTETLLLKHPELDETPGQYPGNKGIYCRSWCPLHPDLPKIIFPMIDELIDAFQADAFHVGMDEVFILGSEFCTRCKGKPTSELFAKSVNDFHHHLVDQKKVEMFMWADRFLDGKATGYGEWEASENNTRSAIDLVPKDIVMCDWHYEVRPDYPSIKILADKGFRVWPSSWRDDHAADLFATAGRMRKGDVVGHLVTTWGAVKVEELSSWPPLKTAFARWIDK